MIQVPQFFLFRIKVIGGDQPSMFEDEQVPSTIITKLVRSKPSVQLRQGHTWHIGNVTSVEGLGLFFALGRTTSSTVERYNQDTQDFVEEDFEASPYTYILFDIDYQILAIAHKQKLSLTAKSTANQLSKLLNDVLNLGTPTDRRIEISTISDPSSFLTTMLEAYAVKRLTFEFGRPNPWDADRDIQQPLQSYLRQIEGDKGATTVEGSDLNRSTAEEIIKATAATGNDAKARIKKSADSGVTTIKLQGNPASMVGEEVETEEGRVDIFRRLRELYLNIRRSPDEQE